MRQCSYAHLVIAAHAPSKICKVCTVCRDYMKRQILSIAAVAAAAAASEMSFAAEAQHTELPGLNIAH
jgi:hypothetical protein